METHSRTCPHRQEFRHTYSRTTPSRTYSNTRTTVGVGSVQSMVAMDDTSTYVCENCDRTFTKKVNLDRHHYHNPKCKPCRMRLRITANTSVVCELCGLRFARLRDRQRHLLDKHNVPATGAYSCPRCGRACENRERLNYHMESVHGVAINLASTVTP